MIVNWIRSGASERDSVLAFAGRELARYVQELTGAEGQVQAASEVSEGTSLPPNSGQIWLGLCDQMPLPPDHRLDPAPWDDGYAIWSGEQGLCIAGRNARSVLFGVYAFLEMQGVRYLAPGPHGEVIPARDALSLPTSPVIQRPAYRHRGVCIEGAPSLEHALGMVDWCTKKGMNTLFLQFLSSQYFYNLWYERPYNPDFADRRISEQEALAMDDRLIAAAKQRGMILHRVGHGWTGAAVGLPRSGWVTSDEPVRPEYTRWLAQVSGTRGLYHDIPINTELCYSHRPAFDAFVETIVRYCEAHPELDVVHVWLSDAVNNKCECDDCRRLTISDWYARIINALSEELYRRVPEMRFVFLCYIELLWPPEQVAIERRHDNAIMMYAPIMRCYGHELADADCDDGEPWPRPALNQFRASRYNAFYERQLQAWRQAFPGDSFDFDYHLMWANWAQMNDVDLAQVIHGDLQRLKASGLDGIVSCQSFRVFYPTGLAMTALAESLWNPLRPWEEMRRRYLAAAYGEHADWVSAYLDQIASYLDAGDPHRRAAPLSTADGERLDEISAFLEAALAELTTRLACGDAVRARALDLLVHHATYLQHVVAAYAARLDGDTAGAETQFDQAAAFLRQTEPDYSTYIDTLLALRALDRARVQE